MKCNCERQKEREEKLFNKTRELAKIVGRIQGELLHIKIMVEIHPDLEDYRNDLYTKIKGLLNTIDKKFKEVNQ